MPLAIPPELKKIQPVVRRAEELDRDKGNPESRLMAYYCRQYAVHTGIPLAGSNDGAKTCLGHLLGKLEEEKATMDQFTRDEAAFLCRKFAADIFDKADAEDREGNAGKNTAKAFYAAATFFEILEQFYPADAGEAAEDRAQDRKRILYSKWKSTEIIKAIKEGREPTPGGFDADDSVPGEEEEEIAEEVASTANSSAANQEDAANFPPPAPSGPPSASSSVPGSIPPPVPRENFIMPPDEPDENPADADENQEVSLAPPPAYPEEDNLSFSLPPPPVDAPVAPPAPPPSAPAPTPAPSRGFLGFGKKTGGKASKAQLSDATELTRFALAALLDRDSDLAADRLQQALKCLGR